MCTRCGFYKEASPCSTRLNNNE